MKIREMFLASSLLLALMASAYLAVSANRQRQAYVKSIEESHAQKDAAEHAALQSQRRMTQLEHDAQRIENQLALLRSELNSAVKSSAEYESDAVELRKKKSELEGQIAKDKDYIAFMRQLENLPHYDTSAQILALPSCSLTAVGTHTCSATFKDVDGKEFYIGSPGATAEVVGFINSLEDGKKYILPKAFEEFQKSRKRYGTPAEVLAMPACTVTVVEKQLCSVLVRDDNFNFLQLGGPGAQEELSGFLQSLEEGESYKLPRAFKDFTNKQVPANPRTPPEPPAEAAPKQVPEDKF